MKRVIKYLLIGLLGVIASLGIAVGLLLGTEAGSRWVLGQVPGLEVTDFQGRLAGRWQASQLVWADGDSKVEVQAALLAWSPACLLRATLCIGQLQAQRIDMAFAPGAEPAESGPLQLPALRLPVAVELGKSRLASCAWTAATCLATCNWQRTGPAAGCASTACSCSATSCS